MRWLTGESYLDTDGVSTVIGVKGEMKVTFQHGSILLYCGFEWFGVVINVGILVGERVVPVCVFILMHLMSIRP